MMTFMNISIFFLCYSAAYSLNPVKTSISILMLSTLVFMEMLYFKGASWFPMIFYLLFMGGILIVFMILSSILPNEKSLKIKNMDLLTVCMVLVSMIWIGTNPDATSMSTYQMKWFFQSGTNLMMTMTLIIMYFFLFILLVTEKKSALRTDTC